MARWHFSGVAGAGMNPLARLLAGRGVTVQGSDRSLDRGEQPVLRSILEAAGVRLVPQDGAAIDAGLEVLVHSTAVESDTPEMRRARELGVRLLPRPQLLIDLVGAAAPGVAVAGTSGKSSVTGMVAWIARALAEPCTILGGAALAEDGASHMGCLVAGPANAPLVAEACESDGTIIGYRPGIALLHNVGLDHADPNEIRHRFRTYLAHAPTVLVNRGQAAAWALAEGCCDARGYGRHPEARLRLETVRSGPQRAQGVVRHGGNEYFLDLPQPGDYQLDNACAALAIADALGWDLRAAAAALTDFPGVARRYQRIGTSEDGITVIDDFAHNPDKVAAVLSAAVLQADRVLAIFQPHGFGPAKHMGREICDALAAGLREHDRCCLAEIYDAGGSADRSISSRDLAAGLATTRPCAYAANHEEVLTWATAEARPGDVVLLMGSRDPRLPGLAQALLDLL
jgi:UDP-N-acetylmuramate--alanine ligase